MKTSGSVQINNQLTKRSSKDARDGWATHLGNQFFQHQQTIRRSLSWNPQDVNLEISGAETWMLTSKERGTLGDSWRRFHGTEVRG